MDYSQFINNYRKNNEEESIERSKQMESKILKENRNTKSHPQPFTILWLNDDKEGTDHIEVFFAMNVKEAKEYVRENYSYVPIFGVFVGESTEDDDLVFNDESI